MLPAESVEWGTPKDLFDILNAEFAFTLDVAASDENAKCKRYFTKEQNGLIQSWAGERCFMNPPYGRAIKMWVSKAWREVKKNEGAELVVGLLPARTDTKWFHDYVLDRAEIRFIKGRVRFVSNKQQMGPSTFPSIVVVWRHGEIKSQSYDLRRFL
jgi:site-specific DNA-methyltransferase (adenine-specific)